MNPATLQLILALVNQIPSVFAAAESIKGMLGESDLAALNAATAAARAAALGAVAQAETDLQAAGQTG